MGRPPPHSGNARKKTFFFPLMSSLNRYVPLCHCHYQSWLRTKIKCHYQGSCEHSKIVSAMELCVLVPFLIYTKSPCSQIFGTCFGFATGLWISNNETTRYSWRRGCSVQANFLSLALWLSEKLVLSLLQEQSWSSHCWESSMEEIRRNKLFTFHFASGGSVGQ